MSKEYYYYDEYEKRVRTDNKCRSEKHFETKEAALKFYQKAEKEALKMFNNYKKEFKAFMEDKPYFIHYVMKGDTHGIYEDYLSLNIEHKGFSFVFSLEDQ